MAQLINLHIFADLYRDLIIISIVSEFNNEDSQVINCERCKGERETAMGVNRVKEILCYLMVRHFLPGYRDRWFDLAVDLACEDDDADDDE